MKKKLHSFLYLLSFISCLSQGFAQPVSSPNVKCLSVNPTNGDVTLTWVTPAGPGGFLDYKIFSAPVAAGPYTLVGTVTTYAQTTFTDVGAGADIARRFYQVQTEYNPGPVLSAPQDTFSTIFLQVTAGAGVANLTWNKISFQNIPTSTGWYKIYREYPTGIWTLRDSTQTLAYTDEIDICSAMLNYRIEISDNTGCTSVSNEAGGSVFTDQTPPVIGPIDTVSVDASNLATISWNPSPSPDADSIVIYKGVTAAGPWNKIATVPVPLTTYTNPASLAGTVSEQYRIAFLDSCSNISPQGIYHQTIYLSASFDICAATASLVWNKYINWSPGVTQYQVLRSINAGPFALIGTTTPSDTDYVDTGIALGNSYCYIIRATNGIKTSSSNKACFIANVTQPPTYNYNRFATVITNNRIDIKAHIDPAATSVKYYNILRAVNGVGTFAVLGPTVPVGSTLSYTDNTVNANVNSYLYRWDAMDSCGHIIMSSNVDTTMLLTASVAPNVEVTLAWNDYANFLGGIDHYEVYRSVDGVWSSSPIGTAPYTSTGGSYTDDVAAFYATSRGIFCYYVVAVEGPGNTFGFTDSSRSNSACVYEFPKAYIPNSFTPNGDGLNDAFIPVVGFIDSTTYLLTIFDRTGTPAASVVSPSAGWDGKKKGHKCPEGVYMYLLQCKASNGDDVQLSGTVSLIR